MDQDAWAWCRLMHFLTHNNYDKAFKISQENALKDTHNKWQYAVIALQLLMDKKKEAKFSLALLEKENAEQDMVFIKSIKNILANKSVELGEGIDRPLILKLLLSKNSVAEKIKIETLSFGMINLIISDPGFDSFSDRIQLSILEYNVEHDESKADLLNKKYNTLATKDEEETLLKKIENKEYDDKNDPLVRAFLYKFFEQKEDEESKKKTFYAFYLNAYRNKILPVAVACFGKDFNLPASNYDKDYAFAFILHNIMLGNASYVQAWMDGLEAKQLSELALMILLRFDADKFSEKTKALLQKELHEPKYDPSLTFLYESKLEDLPAQKPQALKLSDNRLLDVLAGRYGFGKALGILLNAAGTISETDIWQTAVHVRALNAIGLKQQAKDLLTFHAYPQLKGSE